MSQIMKINAFSLVQDLQNGLQLNVKLLSDANWYLVKRVELDNPPYVVIIKSGKAQNVEFDKIDEIKSV